MGIRNICMYLINMVQELTNARVKVSVAPPLAPQAIDSDRVIWET